MHVEEEYLATDHVLLITTALKRDVLNYIIMSCAGKRYHMSYWVDSTYECSLNFSTICTLQNEGKIIDFTQERLTDCENYHFEKFTFADRDSHTIIHIITF